MNGYAARRWKDCERIAEDCNLTITMRKNFKLTSATNKVLGRFTNVTDLYLFLRRYELDEVKDGFARLTALHELKEIISMLRKSASSGEGEYYFLPRCDKSDVESWCRVIGFNIEDIPIDGE